MADRYDVIVAGAGPTGLLAALKLARAGVKVLVVDKLGSVSTAPRAVGYQWPSPLVLDDVGILEDAIEEGLTKTEFDFRNYKTGAVDRLTLTCLEAKEGEPAPYDLHLGQGLLAEIMARHLAKIDCAEIRWNCEVTDIAQDSEEVRVTLETQEGTEQVRGSWLVGADGASSVVRISLGLSFEGKTWPERFVATNVYYDFKSHGYPPATFVRDPVHWAFIIELSRDGLWRITYGEDARLSEDEVRSRMDEHFRGILPDVDEPYELVSINSYQVHERCADAFRVGRVLLAGDAAHICNPSGGFGLLGGIYDANAVAVSLIAVLEGTRDESVLDKYAEERRKIFLEKASPQATLYKKTMMEPEAIAGFDDFITQTAADPAIMRMAMAPPQNLVGSFPIGPGARLG